MPTYGGGSGSGDVTSGSNISDNALTVGVDGTKAIEGATGAEALATIGNIAPNADSVNPGFNLGRTITTFGANAHGFSDVSVFAVAGFGYNPFDARPSIGAGSTIAIDHTASFQSRPEVNLGAGGTCANLYGFWSSGFPQSGTIASNAWSHFYAAALQSSGGTVGTVCAFDDQTLTTDATNTICLRSTSGSRSYHLGRLALGTSTFGGGDTSSQLHVIAVTANNRNLYLTGQSLTGSNASSAIELTGTWNTTGAPSLIKARVTNTASDAASLLLDLGTVAGGALFTVAKTGVVSAPNINGAWADVASAASVDLSAVASNNIRITGTTQIDGFVIAEGRVVNIRFEGALQVTYNATSLILEGTQSITTAANDRLQIIGLGSNNTFGFNFKRADGTPLKLNALYGSDGSTRLNVNYTAQAAGTAYVLTNTAAGLNFGTTDTPITIAAAGVYRISAQVQLTYNGATVSTETATIKVRRTNNTAADVSQLVVIDLPVATTLTHTYGVVAIPAFYYTATAGDILEIYGQVSATLGAGSIDATAVGTVLDAIRIYE